MHGSSRDAAFAFWGAGVLVLGAGVAFVWGVGVYILVVYFRGMFFVFWALYWARWAF